MYYRILELDTKFNPMSHAGIQIQAILVGWLFSLSLNKSSKRELNIRAIIEMLRILVIF